MSPAISILIFPDIKGILPQAGIGTERTGFIYSMEDFITLAPFIVPHAEYPLACRLQLVKLIGIHVADIEDIVFRLHNGAGHLVL